MPKRGNLALAACEACRRRKVRCDGARPVCGACVDRKSTCTFESLPGVTRTAALKSEISQLRANSNALLDLYWQLRSGSASDAWQLVEQIRSGEQLVNLPPRADAGQESVSQPPPRPSRVVDALDTATSSGIRKSHQPMISSSSTSTQNPTKHAVDRGLTSGRSFGKSAIRDAPMEAQSTSTEPGDTESTPFEEFDFGAAMHGDESDVLLHYSLQTNLETIQKGFDVQQTCMSETFFCYDRDAFETLVGWLKQDLAAPPTSSILCELCAVAVVAGQHVCDSFEPGLLSHWYDSSRQRFDDCMEVNPASAIKVAAMLGLYNLLQKPTLAITYLEMGLSLSARYLEDNANEDDFLVNNEILGTFRTRRSLAFCHGWLQATLGHGSTTTDVSIPPGRKSAKSLMMIQNTETPNASDHDLVRGEVTTIAILKATAMRMLWACSDVPDLLHSIQDLQEQLGGWYGDLPDAAQLVQLGGDAQIALKSSIYYVHLLHMGAVMLIFRHCLAGLQLSKDRETLSVEQRLVMNAALNDGLQAAQHSAQMTYLIQQISRSMRHGWTMIYQAYVSGMILIYDATQLRLAGFSGKHCAMSFDLAGKVVDGLDFCRELDPLARKLTANLSEHYERLRGADPHTIEVDDPDNFAPPQTGDYLFNISPESADLHDTSCGLFEQLCNPYADGEAIVAEREVSSSPRPHSSRTSRFPWKSRSWQGYVGSGYGEAPLAITAEISNLEDGYFVRSRDPSWWLAMRSSAAHNYEGRPLEVS